MNTTAFHSGRAARSVLAGTVALAAVACNQALAAPTPAPFTADGTMNAARGAVPTVAVRVAQARIPPEPAIVAPPEPPERATRLPQSPPGAGKPTAASARAVGDTELAARVKSAVLAEPLSALMFDVNVANGVVTLTGTADTAETRDKAVRAASAVHGVRSVNNRISVLGGS